MRHLGVQGVCVRVHMPRGSAPGGPGRLAALAVELALYPTPATRPEEVASDGSLPERMLAARPTRVAAGRAGCRGCGRRRRREGGRTAVGHVGRRGCRPAHFCSGHNSRGTEVGKSLHDLVTLLPRPAPPHCSSPLIGRWRPPPSRRRQPDPYSDAPSAPDASLDDPGRVRADTSGHEKRAGACTGPSASQPTTRQVAAATSAAFRSTFAASPGRSNGFVT